MIGALTMHVDAQVAAAVTYWWEMLPAPRAIQLTRYVVLKAAPWQLMAPYLQFQSPNL